MLTFFFYSKRDAFELDQEKWGGGSLQGFQSHPSYRGQESKESIAGAETWDLWA